MKKTLIALSLVAALGLALSATAQVTVVKVDSNCLFIEPLQDLPDAANPIGWTARIYNTAGDAGKGQVSANPLQTGGWQDGKHSVGYGDNDDNTVILDDDGAVPSVYTRTPFTVADPTGVTDIHFTADNASDHYDDAAVIYINGVEVAADSTFNGIARPLHWNSVNGGGNSIDVDITAIAKPLLVAGTNILACAIYNDTLTGSSDLSLWPILTITGGGASEGGAVGDDDDDVGPVPDEFALYPTSALLNVGDSLTYYCVLNDDFVDGVSTYLWRKNGVVITDGPIYDISVDDVTIEGPDGETDYEDVGILTINPLVSGFGRDDSGNYACTVLTAGGDTYTTPLATLVVKQLVVGVPVAGLLGLSALVAALALGGPLAMRKK